MTTLAVRTHDMQRVEAFYAEALGLEFHDERVGRLHLLCVDEVSQT